jgi:iron complex outermembrane recepter protein
VDTFEIGYRDILFDGQVQFTSAIFYNKYKGIHVTTSGTLGNADISNALINLGEARTYGAEAAITWSVSDALTLSANLGYLNAKYQKAEFPGNAFLLPLNASGQQLILAPEWQGGAQVSFEQPISNSHKVSANLLYSYISAHVFQTEESQTVQKGYSLVNARVGFATINDAVGIYAFANNVFDQRYLVFGTISSIGEAVTPGNPRIFGLTLEFNFF